MKKKIGILVESYYRTPQPNGICTRAIAEELYKQDHDVTVFTSKRGLNQPKSEKVNGIEILRFNRSLAFLFRNISNYYTKRLSIIARLISKTLFKIDNSLKFFAWPLHSILLIFKYIYAVNKVHKNKELDVLVGVYLHLEEVIAAIIIKKNFPKIKLVIYTLDALSGRTVPKIFGTKKFAEISVKLWEKIIFNNADIICAMESHREHYNHPSYDNIRTKLKFMDIPYLKFKKNDALIERKSDKVSIVYTGFSSETTGAPFYFIEALKLIKNVEFHMYGGRSKNVERFIGESGLLNKVIYLHGRKPHDEIIKIQQSADILVNFGNDNSCMVPSKIFEYISNKKPIISFYNISNDASYPYLKRYANSLLIKEEKALFEENVNSLEKFIFADNYTEISDDFLLKNFYNNTPYPMVEEILKTNF